MSQHEMNDLLMTKQIIDIQISNFLQRLIYEQQIHEMKKKQVIQLYT
jgi:hypothetical protein